MLKPSIVQWHQLLVNLYELDLSDLIKLGFNHREPYGHVV